MRTPSLINLDGLLSPQYIIDKIFEKKSLYKNIEVYSYENTKNQGIEKHFLQLLKIENTDIFNFNVNNIHASNRSLHITEALFMNEMQAIPLREKDKFDLYFYLLKNCATSLKKDYLFISPQRYREVAAEQSAALERLASLMRYSRYGEDSLDWLENMDVCPWKRLPQELWEEIFCNLPEQIQAAVREALPPHRSPYQSARLFSNPDFFPGYLLKTSTDSATYPQTYPAAVAAARQTRFDPSCKNSPYGLSPLFWRFKNLHPVACDKRSGDFIPIHSNEIYRKLLLTELANKVDEATFSVLSSEKYASDENFLEQILFKIIYNSHRNYIFSEARRLAGRDIYFWGCGEIYNSLHVFFNKSTVKAILVDQGSHADLVNGIPVYHPDALLPQGENTPIVIFSNQSLLIYGKIQENYPQYTDIVTCTMP